MFLIQVLLVFIWSTAVLSISTPMETQTASTSTYDQKFDNIDLDELLGNERLLRNYIKCLEFEGPCTPDSKMLRDTLPDAVLTNCERCSERQKFGSDKVAHYLIDHNQEDWARLEKMYDPEGGYRKAYMEEKAKMVPDSQNEK